MTLKEYQNKQNSATLTPNSTFCFIQVKIDEMPTLGKNAYRAKTLMLQSVDSLNHAQRIRGNLLVYFKKDTISSNLKYGDQLLIKSQIQEISLPRNPGEFNYKNYLQGKHIFYQVYVNHNQYKILPEKAGSWLMTWTYKSQNYIKNTLQTFSGSKNELGIGEALLFGFDDDIDPEIYKTYSRTGTLHVLAVSGMHVGLIFMLLGLLLAPLQKLKKGKFIKPILLLSGVWLYSVLCGLSPSILRASVMLSFMVIGELIQRKSNHFNSLAASAFLLLVYDTSVISNVGFQLSYAAVLGIIGFYKILYELLEFESRLGDSIWKVVAVSLAAQTLTFPMSLFYFHQFPNYFLLANLLIIPITTLIIYNGILLLVFSKIVFAGKLLGACMVWLISVSNWIAAFIGNLPGACFENIHFSFPVLLLSYGLMIPMIIFFQKKELFMLKMSGALILVILCIQIQENYQTKIQKALIIYSIKNHNCIQFIYGPSSILYADTGLLNNKASMNLHLQGVYCEKEINTYSDRKLPFNNNIITYPGGKKLMILNNNSQAKNQNFELVFLDGKNFIELNSFLNNNRVKQLVLGGSLSNKKRIALKKIAAIYQIPCFDITENGAFQLSL